MTTRRLIVALTLTSLLLVVVPGCGGGGGKVTKENFEKIKTGMTLDEVEAILGKGAEKVGMSGGAEGLTGSMKLVVWEDGDKVITLTFKDGKVAMPPIAKGL